jgi:hypothetical protein
MKGEKWVLGGIVVVALFIIALVMLKGVSQMAIGNIQTQQQCLDSVKSWCNDGYACSACAQKTLSFSLVFDDGTVTNKVWSADCVLGSANTANAHTACADASLITLHAYKQCVNNVAVYWFDSLGIRNDLLDVCSNGCTQTSLTSASCNAGTSPPPSGTPKCFDGNTLCIGSLIYADDNDGLGQYIKGCTAQQDCPSSTVCRESNNVGACIVQTCSNKCSAGEFGSCISPTQFKSCQPQSNGCYDYTIGTCPSDYPACVSVGLCGITGTSECTIGEQVCISDSQYTFCSAEGLLTVDCDPDQKCVGTRCVKTNTSQPVDACKNIVCQDYCDGTTLKTAGTCKDGQCIYDKSEIASSRCFTKDTCTEDGSYVDCNGKTQTIACIDGKYVIASRPCIKESFLDKYGLWIGGILIVILVIVYVNIPAKKKRSKRGRKR